MPELPICSNEHQLKLARRRCKQGRFLSAEIPLVWTAIPGSVSRAPSAVSPRCVHWITLVGDCYQIQAAELCNGESWVRVSGFRKRHLVRSAPRSGLPSSVIKVAIAIPEYDVQLRLHV